MASVDACVSMADSADGEIRGDIVTIHNSADGDEGIVVEDHRRRGG